MQDGLAKRDRGKKGGRTSLFARVERVDVSPEETDRRVGCVKAAPLRRRGDVEKEGRGRLSGTDSVWGGRRARRTYSVLASQSSTSISEMPQMSSCQSVEGKKSRKPIGKRRKGKGGEKKEGNEEEDSRISRRRSLPTCQLSRTIFIRRSHPEKTKRIIKRMTTQEGQERGRPIETGKQQTTNLQLLWLQRLEDHPRHDLVHPVQHSLDLRVDAVDEDAAGDELDVVLLILLGDVDVLAVWEEVVGGRGAKVVNLVGEGAEDDVGCIVFPTDY
jgi:hypothetical protein